VLLLQACARAGSISSSAASSSPWHKVLMGGKTDDVFPGSRPSLFRLSTGLVANTLLSSVVAQKVADFIWLTEEGFETVHSDHTYDNAIHNLHTQLVQATESLDEANNSWTIGKTRAAIDELEEKKTSLALMIAKLQKQIEQLERLREHKANHGVIRGVLKGMTMLAVKIFVSVHQPCLSMLGIRQVTAGGDDVSHGLKLCAFLINEAALFFASTWNVKPKNLQFWKEREEEALHNEKTSTWIDFFNSPYTHSHYLLQARAKELSSLAGYGLTFDIITFFFTKQSIFQRCSNIIYVLED